ncbi:Major cell-surface adhesin PAc [Dissostichus eleginoides]|uniref:Major cell-surface adhesin PAc n=1 Tax=Dissostichus eleginoides TaxID=100907 RepID=A0AAD9CHW4_DISEL|nr:Major cell-surface adhesin PAc [Dissostichus eleginoides]
MEDSEQSHWVSPALLSSDPLAGFSSEPGLLPPGDEAEAFSPARNRTTPASIPSSPPRATAERLPPTDTARSDRCSPPRASWVTCSCWTGQAAATPPTPPLDPPGAAAPSLRCTPTPPPPSTPPASPPPSPPPGMDMGLRAGRAPGSRRP